MSGEDLTYNFLVELRSLPPLFKVIRKKCFKKPFTAEVFGEASLVISADSFIYIRPVEDRLWAHEKYLVCFYYYPNHYVAKRRISYEMDLGSPSVCFRAHLGFFKLIYAYLVGTRAFQYLIKVLV